MISIVVTLMILTMIMMTMMMMMMKMMMILPEPVGGAFFEGTAVRKISRVRHLIIIIIIHLIVMITINLIVMIITNQIFMISRHRGGGECKNEIADCREW